MANIKITDLNNFADPNSTDVLPIVDVANDETKKVSIGNLMKSAVAGTAALPGVAFAVDEDTGMYRNASDQLAFATGGTERILIDDNGDVTISGSLTVNGTTTTIDSTTLTVEDKNIELGVVDTPTDTTADGGGITLKGATDKTLNWVDSTDSWTSSENVDLASGKTYKINGTDVLSATALGSAVQISSDNIPSGTIVNDDVNASAAIAGTKIDPDFGSQTVETTGVFSAAGGAESTPSIAFTGDLNTGIYSPGADQVAISTGGTTRLYINSSGQVGVGSASPDATLHLESSAGAQLRIKAGSTSDAQIDLIPGGETNPFFIYCTSSRNLIFQDNATERLRIDSSGRLLVGTNSAYGSVVNNGAVTPTKQLAGTGNSDTATLATNWANNSSGAPSIQLAKSRGASKGTHTVVVSGDRLGTYSFAASDGAKFVEAASIEAQVDGTPGTDDMPGRLVFSTNGGAATPTERMRISANGNITVDTNTFFVDAVNDRVGIGTDSPSTLLHIADSTKPILRIDNTDTTLANGDDIGSVEWFINDASSGGTGVGGEIALVGDGTMTGGGVATRMEFRTYDDSTLNTGFTLDQDGRIGIGTTNPLNTLDVRQDANGDILRLNTASDSGQGIILGVDTSSSVTYWKNNTSSTYDMRFEVGGGEKLRIDSSGRLLVGTSSSIVDTDNFQIKDDDGAGILLQRSSGTNGAATGGITFRSSTGNQANIASVNDGSQTSGSSPGRLVFSTTADGASSPTERMRIDSAGRIGFGGAFDLTASNRVSINPADGLIGFGMDGRDSYVTSTSGCYIYSGSGASGTTLAGELILQSRSNVNRDISFITGSTPAKRMSIFGSGAVEVYGAFSKGSGSFKIDHPLPAKTATHNLVHSFIEGPQADLIYRGKVDLTAGAATVNLDIAARMTEGTFVLLNTNVQCFTSNESDWTAVRGSVSGNILTIAAEDNTSTATVSWLVIGERQDQHMLDTDWTDENGRVITEPLKETELVSEDPEAN